MICPICDTRLSCHGDFLFCDTPGCEIFPGVDNIEVESVRLQIDHGIEPEVESTFWLGQGYLALTQVATPCSVPVEIAKERQ